MLRFLLAIVLLAIVGVVAFYAGRSTAPAPAAAPVASAPETPASEPSAPAEDASRARTMTEPATGPVIPGSEPSLSPPAGLPTNPAMPGQAARTEGDPSGLAGRRFALPVANAKPDDIIDTYNQARGNERRHEAAYIMAPRGTPVYAVDNGIVRKLFNSVPGGLTVYQFDSTERYCYYYAHLDRYAEGLREGMLLKRGDLVGYVGSTGNADPSAPHLHFAVFELGPEKKWHEGKPINPYPLLASAFKNR